MAAKLSGSKTNARSQGNLQQARGGALNSQIVLTLHVSTYLHGNNTLETPQWETAQAFGQKGHPSLLA